MSEGYEPFGGAYSMWCCHNLGILYDGPAGTGKTRAALEKLDLACRKHDGMRAAIVRKTRHSLTESALVTYENKVLHPERDEAILSGPSRAHRQAYQYPNGSTIVLAGMDKPERIMSTEFDMILVVEATELSEDEGEKLTTRLRNGVVPYQQIIYECNPGAPTHWLKKSADAGKLTRIMSRHEDNPSVTPEYLSILDNLSGHRLLRLRKGIWAAAEGVVYPEYDAAVHWIEPFTIPATWRKFRSIDFGYTNPFVCQWWAIDEDGRMYLYREIYKSKTLVSTHAERIAKLSAGEKYDCTVADHDAEGRATLDAAGISSVPAEKNVEHGIQAVTNRLKRAGDGLPRLYIFQDALVERDMEMETLKKPCCTAEEFDGYMWKKAPDGKPIKEEPNGIDDHGCDALRYAVMRLDGAMPVSVGIVSMGAPPPPPPDKRAVTEQLDEKRKDPDWGFGNGSGGNRVTPAERYRR